MSNSINTNLGAQVALQNLNSVNRQLEMTQKRVSTGLKVADATDDGAAFAIAQGLRSDMKGLAAVNSQLGVAQGLVEVASAAAKSISDTLGEVRSVLTKLADAGVTGNERTQYEAQYTALKNEITNFISNADFNGTNLIEDGASSVNVIADLAGNTYTITAQNLKTAVSDSLGAAADATAAQTLLTGGFASAENALGTAMNALAADANRLTSQANFNEQLSDATARGLGSIVDADLAKESARLQSLQTQQQLAVQALGIANQAPLALLNLFR